MFVTYDHTTSSILQGATVLGAVLGSGGGLTGSSEVTVTLAVTPPEVRAELVHAVRTGDVTLVRSTFVDDPRGRVTFRPPPEGA